MGFFFRSLLAKFSEHFRFIFQSLLSSQQQTKLAFRAIHLIKSFILQPTALNIAISLPFIYIYSVFLCVMPIVHLFD